jgi:hypothetical protein
MPGRAKSEAAKHWAALHAMREHEERAVETYNREMDAFLNGAGRKPTYRSVAKRFDLDYRLLQRRQQGTGLTKQASNARRSHLTENEALALIDFTIAMAHRGFPLRLKELGRHGLEIAQLRQPNLKKFSHNWAQRFMTKYGTHVSTKWSMSLDSIRAKSVTPAVCEHYFDLLKKTLEEHGILPHNIYGFDESGFPLGGGGKTRVIGPITSKSAKRQRNGNKENVTVMACICADGSNVPPVVIFSGQNFLEKWRQKNPIGAACVLLSF